MKITIEDERSQKKHELFYKGGIVSFVEHLNRAKTAIHSKVIYLYKEKERALMSKSPCSGMTAM